MKRFLYVLVFLWSSTLLAQTNSSASHDNTNLAADQGQQWLEQHTFVFTENKGQILDTENQPCPHIKYVARTPQANVFITENSISYVVSGQALRPAQAAQSSADFPWLHHRIDVEFVGMKPNSTLVTEEEIPGHTNYYLNNQEVTQVKSYKRIVYTNVYENIDLTFYYSAKGVWCDFTVKPGGNIADIQMRYDGANQVSVGAEGQLRVANALQTAQTSVPLMQHASSESTLQGMQAATPTEFVMLSNNVVGIHAPVQVAKETIVITIPLVQ